MRMEISQRVAGHTCSLERLQEKIKRDVVKKGEFEWELRKENKKKKEAYNTCCSQAVTHPSTGQAQHCLTSVI